MKHLKKCSTSLVIKEMQVKNHKKTHHYLAIRTADMQKVAIRYWQGHEDTGALTH